MLKEIVTQVILNAFKEMSLSNFTRIKEGALNRYDILVIQLNCIMFWSVTDKIQEYRLVEMEEKRFRNRVKLNREREGKENRIDDRKRHHYFIFYLLCIILSIIWELSDIGHTLPNLAIA